MRIKTILQIIIVVIAICTVSTANAQFAVGLRDTRYIYGDYTFLNHYNVKLEHSVFSEKMQYQLVKLYLGYENGFKCLNYGGDAFYGRTYKDNFYTLGAHAFATINFARIMSAKAVVAPIYDSGFGYKTCYEIEPEVALTREVAFNVAYTTIPEYREYDERVRCGFRFRVLNLTAAPAVSIPVSGSNRFKSIRVLASFNYTF
jgi:hypothetical protein